MAAANVLLVASVYRMSNTLEMRFADNWVSAPHTSTARSVGGRFPSENGSHYTGVSQLEGPTRKPQHASVFSTHSDTRAVPAFHCIRMFKGILSTR